MSPRVLVLDDEANIRDLLSIALGHVGYDVVTAETCMGARNMLVQQSADLLIFDVMLPDGDGIELCQRLRRDGVKTPVLFLTARDATEDKVRGLTVGGDDYVTKPFSLEELIARVRVLLRRSGVEQSDGRVINVGDLSLDEDAYEVRRAGTPVSLSPTEFKLLRYLMVNAGRVLSKAQILDHVWQYDFGGEANVVETYVSYLRKKLDPLGVPLIQTIRGVGYIIRPPA